MTWRTWAAIAAIAVLLAIVVTLLSGAWRQPALSSEGSIVPDASEPALTAEGAVGSVLLGGYATWYATPGLTAAAGPELRGALGDWRGQWVTVESGRRSVTVQITDWCACGDRHGIPTIIDLSRDAFAELEDPSRGIVRVSIEIGLPPHPDDERMRLEDMRLPATDAL